jgi:hypothetical protein
MTPWQCIECGGCHPLNAERRCVTCAGVVARKAALASQAQPDIEDTQPFSMAELAKALGMVPNWDDVLHMVRDAGGAKAKDAAVVVKIPGADPPTSDKWADLARRIRKQVAQSGKDGKDKA